MNKEEFIKLYKSLNEGTIDSLYEFSCLKASGFDDEVAYKNIIDLKNMYDYLDLRQIKRLRELVPYKVLAPDADEIIKELERLNNIINKLEKWLDKEEKLTFNSWNKGIHEVQRKLQELKGE